MDSETLSWSLFARYVPAYGKPIEGMDIALFRALPETIWFFFQEDRMLTASGTNVVGIGYDAHAVGNHSLPLGGNVLDWVESVTAVHPLGTFDGHPCCAVQAAADSDRREPGSDGFWTGVPDGFHWQPLREVIPTLDGDAGFLAGRALQILNWRRNNQFCGRCGTEMEPRADERAMACPKCGFLQYPRLSPAIIVAVTRGDALLLAHGNHFPAGMYSIVAGFVEPGETFEDCISREVQEEIGIRVKDIRYLSSQPWPFPDSLMVGFTAEWASGGIQVDGVEIGDAKWYTREAMPSIPGPHSIAGRIIRKWLNGPL